MKSVTQSLFLLTLVLLIAGCTRLEQRPSRELILEDLDLEAPRQMVGEEWAPTATGTFATPLGTPPTAARTSISPIPTPASISPTPAPTPISPTRTPVRICTERECGITLTVALGGAVPYDYSLVAQAPDGDRMRIRCVGGKGPYADDLSEPTRYAICQSEGVAFVGFSPDRVTIAVSGDGRTVSKTFRPDYDTVYPNGPDCPPTCRLGHVTLVFPGPPTPTPTAPVLCIESTFGDAAIFGRVLWGATPVAGARVELRTGAWADPRASDILACTFADDSGHYQLQAPPVEGEFGLVALWPDGGVNAAPVTPVQVVEGAELTGIDVYLAKGARPASPCTTTFEHRLLRDPYPRGGFPAHFTLSAEELDQTLATMGIADLCIPPRFGAPFISTDWDSAQGTAVTGRSIRLGFEDLSGGGGGSSAFILYETYDFLGCTDCEPFARPKDRDATFSGAMPGTIEVDGVKGFVRLKPSEISLGGKTIYKTFVFPYETHYLAVVYTLDYFYPGTDWDAQFQALAAGAYPPELHRMVALVEALAMSLKFERLPEPVLANYPPPPALRVPAYTPQASPGTLVYENERGGFSIELPDDWIVQQDPSARLGHRYAAAPAALIEFAESDFTVFDAEEVIVERALAFLCQGEVWHPQPVTLTSGLTVQHAICFARHPDIPRDDYYFVEHGDWLIFFRVKDPLTRENLLDLVNTFRLSD